MSPRWAANPGRKYGKKSDRPAPLARQHQHPSRSNASLDQQVAFFQGRRCHLSASLTPISPPLGCRNGRIASLEKTSRHPNLAGIRDCREGARAQRLHRGSVDRTSRMDCPTVRRRVPPTWRMPVARDHRRIVTSFNPSAKFSPPNPCRVSDCSAEAFVCLPLSKFHQAAGKGAPPPADRVKIPICQAREDGPVVLGTFRCLTHVLSDRPAR